MAIGASSAAFALQGAAVAGVAIVGTGGAIALQATAATGTVVAGVSAAGFAGAAGYVGTQAGISAAETTIEWAMATPDDEFSTLEVFGKNFAVNLISGGIASKGRWAAKVSAYVLRQSIEIGAETAYDVHRGRDFGTSLLVNTVGSIGGEAVFKGAAYGLKRGVGGAGKLLAAHPGANPLNYRLDVNPNAALYGGLPLKSASVRYVGPRSANDFSDELTVSDDIARSRLRSALGLVRGDADEAHHLLPVGLRDHPIVERAARSGFNFNGDVNGMPLSFDRHRGVNIFHHDMYNAARRRRLDLELARTPNMTDAEAADFLNSYTDTLRNVITRSRARLR